MDGAECRLISDACVSMRVCLDSLCFSSPQQRLADEEEEQQQQQSPAGPRPSHLQPEQQQHHHHGQQQQQHRPDMAELLRLKDERIRELEARLRELERPRDERLAELEARLRAQEACIAEQQELLGQRETAIGELRSDLDKFLSVLPFKSPLKPSPRKQRAQGISAEPPKELTELVPVDKSDRSIFKMTTLLKPYSIVEFVSRGRKSKQSSVDIVPTKWIDFNKSRKKGTTKFLSAIENEEDKRLIHDIVKDLSDPPESWTIFSVIIFGDADTYENAEEKVVRLEAENHVFSLESGEELEERQSKVLKEIKRQKLLKEEADLNTLLEPSLEEIESDDDGDLKLGYSSEKKHFFDSDLSDDNFSNLANKEEQSDQVNIKTYSKLNNLSYSSKNPGVFPHVEMHNISSKSSDPLEISIHLPVINMPSVQSVQEFQTQVLANLTMILSELKVTNNRLDNIDKYLCDNSVNQINQAFNVIDFEKKYNIKLPIEEKSIFIEFNETLKLNKYMKKELIGILKTCLDQENFIITKSILNMLRKFLGKAVAMQYTATRKSLKEDKSIFKSTEFYSAIEYVIIKAREEKHLETTEKALKVKD